MIDKKGRIFGKINIIDLVVLILILCLIGGVIYNVFFKKDEIVAAPVKETGTATITLRIYGAYPEWVETLVEGDELIIADQLTDMKIISVTHEKNLTTATTAEGEVVVAEHPFCVDCTIVVKGSASRDALGVTIMDELYRESESKVLRTSSYYGSARVLDVQFEPAQ